MFTNYNKCEACPVAQIVKTLPAMRETWVGGLGWIPGLERSPEWGQGNPLQYSCLENPMVRGAWRLQPMGSRRIGHNWVTNTHTWLWQGLPVMKEAIHVYGQGCMWNPHTFFSISLWTWQLYFFLSLKISLWLFKLLSQTFHFPICFKCPCNCRCSILWQLFKILIILGSVSFSFGICWFSFHSTSDFPIFDSRGKELILIISYQVEVSPAFPLSLCGHLVGRFYWFFRGGVGIKTTPIRPPFLLHWLRGQLFLGI